MQCSGGPIQVDERIKFGNQLDLVILDCVHSLLNEPRNLTAEIFTKVGETLSTHSSISCTGRGQDVQNINLAYRVKLKKHKSALQNNTVLKPREFNFGPLVMSKCMRSHFS